VTRLVSSRIQQSVEGTQGDGTSFGAAISADGMTVAFTSSSRYMVFSDTTSNGEIFARNMATNAIVRLSEPAAGGQPNANCSEATLSANGRYVAFVTAASNLDPDAGTGVQNIILKDRDADNDGVLDEAGQITFRSVSKGYNPFIIGSPIVNLNHTSHSPSISDDGSTIAFSSIATNYFCSILNGCTDTNGVEDVFVFETAVGHADRVSLSSTNAQATEASVTPAISGNGRFVAFVSAQHTLDGAGFNPGEEVYVRALESLGNDSCANAVPVTAASSTFADNWGPFDANATECNAASNSGVWFTHTAACTGTLTINTIGSSFDTILSIYQGSCPFDAAELVGCNDDSAGTLGSTVTFDATEGQTYAIRVGGFGNRAGMIQLNVSACTPACPADYNHDGGVDGDDVIAFFGDWDAGNNAADFNSDGGVDGDDVIQFFGHWDSGC
ncbi:MAG: GC-type dockerin domain-anchored protein, partial [Phycisphaerales bacterium]